MQKESAQSDDYVLRKRPKSDQILLNLASSQKSQYLVTLGGGDPQDPQLYSSISMLTHI